jgi:hypothetical protein
MSAVLSPLIRARISEEKLTRPLAHSFPSGPAQVTGSPASKWPGNIEDARCQEAFAVPYQGLDGSLIQLHMAARPQSKRNPVFATGQASFPGEKTGCRRIARTARPEAVVSGFHLESGVATPYSPTFLAARTLVAMPPVPSKVDDMPARCSISSVIAGISGINEAVGSFRGSTVKSPSTSERMINKIRIDQVGDLCRQRIVVSPRGFPRRRRYRFR